MGATVEELRVGDAPAAWAALGFALAGESLALGEVRLRAAGPEAGRGLVGWTLRGAGSAELDGLPTTLADGDGESARADGELALADGELALADGDGELALADGERLGVGDAGVSSGGDGAPVHPNGIAGLDHVVAITPRLERTIAALEAAGLDLRRIREEPTPAGAPRQAFFRLGPTILEVVQEPADVAERNGPDRPAFFWGLALLAPDLEATVAALGEERVSEIRPAIQPGRRIATLRRAAGLSLPVALITPKP